MLKVYNLAMVFVSLGFLIYRSINMAKPDAPVKETMFMLLAAICMAVSYSACSGL